MLVENNNWLDHIIVYSQIIIKWPQRYSHKMYYLYNLRIDALYSF